MGFVTNYSKQHHWQHIQQQRMVEMIESKSSSAKSVIHHSELKRLLSYDRDTGSFTWLVSPRNGVPVGAAAGNLAHVNRIKRY